MAVNILIKPEKKSGGKFGLKSLFGKNDKLGGTLTFSELKKIGGNEFIYGHRNRSGYVFDDYNEEDIINVDIVLYNPQHIGRGFIVCQLENGSIELVLNVPSTSQDVRDFFYMVKKMCEHVGVNEFIMDEERVVKFDEIDDLKNSLIEWNMEVLEHHLKEIDNGSMITLGGNNPVEMEAEVHAELKLLSGNELEKAFADYINQKQQMDVYHMKPRFYQTKDGSIMGVYALTEGVDSVIPAEAHVPFNSGLGEDTEVNRWLVSLVANTGKEYDVVGYLNYPDLITNLPADQLTVKYDQRHYVLKGITKEIIEKLLVHQVEL